MFCQQNKKSFVAYIFFSVHYPKFQGDILIIKKVMWTAKNVLITSSVTHVGHIFKQR